MSASITHWLRIEPRPRSNFIEASLAAEIRDPAWFLARQWQLGEFAGADAGSAAWVDYTGHSAQLPRFTVGNSTRNVDPKAPLERQTLVEPFAPDGILQVELSQNFAEILAAEVQNATTTENLLAAFLTIPLYKFKAAPAVGEFNPLDPSSSRFYSVCVGRELDGYQLYLLGKAGGPVPTAVTTNPTEIAKVLAALTKLVTRTEQVFGTLGTTDPEGWKADRLEYGVKVIAANATGAGNATMTAEPNSTGEFDWYSFDVVAKNTTASEEAPKGIDFTMIPSDARFPGMPSQRFWMFETNELPFVDIKPDKRDLMKLIVADFMLVHGNNWYCLPVPQDVGTLVVTERIVVTDVFGHQTIIDRADAGATAPGTNRWTMFSNTDVSAQTETLTNSFILTPSPGPAMQLGQVLEDVRFGRDEMANMAWAIERVTESPIGEPRSGRERDAEVAQSQHFPPPGMLGTSPLRYLIETKVPVNWIPLVAVKPDSQNPSIELEKAAALHATVAAPGVGAVQSLGRILQPTAVVPPPQYRIKEEEIPRDGTRIERVTFRSRWYDGSTHLWVQRRRLASAGESQAGLRFDQALPNQR
jgi:hypothetical protein